MDCIEELIEIISSIPEDYSICIHGINGTGDFIERAKSTLLKGLNNSGWGGVLSNSKIIGQKKNLKDRDYLEMLDYSYGYDNNGTVVNLIIALPEVIKDKDGKEYYLGHFNKIPGISKGKDEAGDSLPINQLIEAIEYIPKEFIVGYYYGTYKSKDFTFVRNPNYIGNESIEKQEDFYNALIVVLKKMGYLSVSEEEKQYEIAKLKLKDPDLYFEKNEYYKQLGEYIKRKRQNNK